MNLLRHHKVVVLYIVKINQIDGDMVAILAKGKVLSAINHSGSFH